MLLLTFTLSSLQVNSNNLSNIKKPPEKGGLKLLKFI